MPEKSESPIQKWLIALSMEIAWVPTGFILFSVIIPIVAMLSFRFGCKRFLIFYCRRFS